MTRDIFAAPIQTVQPTQSCIRLQYYYHSVATGADYLSRGELRAAEHHCIFHYTLSGRGECTRAGVKYPICPGQGFLHIINEEGSGYGYPENAAGAEPWEFVCVCFEGGSARQTVAELIEQHGPVFTLQAGSTLKARLANDEFWRQRITLSRGKSLLLASEILSELIDIAGAGSFPRAVEGARSLVLAAGGRNVNVSELAAQLNVSREHLSRLFAEYTGLTLRQYIAQQRLLYICSLLKDSALSVEQIAQISGYSTAANLTRSFRLTMRQTPGQFRKSGVMPVF